MTNLGAIKGTENSRRTITKLAAAFVAVAIVIGYTVIGNAQPPRARGADGTKGTPPTASIVAYLTLTDTQLASFAAIRENTRTAAQPILEQIRTKRDALREARQAGNTSLVTSLRAEIAELDAQVEKLHDDAQVQMAGSLNADQKSKLATLTAAAQLFDEVRGAAGLGLLTPPDGVGREGGFGRGKGFRGGPGGPKGGF